MAKKGQKFTNYSFEFKLLVVNKYFEGEMGYKALAKEYGLPDHSYVRSWVNKYRELGKEGLSDRRGKSELPMKGIPRTSPMSLEEENKILKMENEFLKKLRFFQRR